MLHQDWAKDISQAMRETLALPRRPDASSFVQIVSEHNPALWEGERIEDPVLNAVWNFADVYSFCWTHLERDMEGIPWQEAEPLMRNTADRLERGEPIDDSRILRYRWRNKP